MKLEEIEQLIKSGKTLEEILKLIDWKEFEEKVEEIFKIHGFKTIRNFRFKTKKRYEIDLVAEKDYVIFAVDCKKWSRGRYKISELKKFAVKQKERALELKNFFKTEKDVIPLILTLYDEGINEFEGTLIIPSFKLNNFLLQY
ncbi:MAG: restriction endonuclease [Candidatus Aenigmatarchaeota archaeon]